MKVDIVLDDHLVAEAARLSGIERVDELIQEALDLLIETRKRKSLLDLAGRIRFAPGYDHKALRTL